MNMQIYSVGFIDSFLHGITFDDRFSEIFDENKRSIENRNQLYVRRRRKKKTIWKRIYSELWVNFFLSDIIYLFYNDKRNEFVQFTMKFRILNIIMGKCCRQFRYSWQWLWMRWAFICYRDLRVNPFIKF